MIQDWTPQDAALSREYFNSLTGQKLLLRRRTEIDKLDAAGSTFEATALSAKEAKGGRDLLRRIIEDAEWNDAPQVETPFVDITK